MSQNTFPSAGPAYQMTDKISRHSRFIIQKVARACAYVMWNRNRTGFNYTTHITYASVRFTVMNGSSR